MTRSQNLSSPRLTRRDWLGAAAAVGVGASLPGCASSPSSAARPAAERTVAKPPAAERPVAEPPTDSATASELVALEQRVGGRLGVFALDTGSARSFGHRADERFAMCSTFKWVLAAAVLAAVDRGALRLEQPISYGPEALLEYAPVTRAHVAQGALSVAELARAAVVLSDNTAANLLLPYVDGPSGLTAFARAQGDPVTRLDRTEPSLNENAPGDPRDTTSPRAMVALGQRLLSPGGALSSTSRERLTGWLRACETGAQRIRAGLPPEWAAGDKTGTGAHGAVNDVAIAWPPGRAPLLIAVYLSESRASVEALNAVHAEIGALAAGYF